MRPFELSRWDPFLVIHGVIGLRRSGHRVGLAPSAGGIMKKIHSRYGSLPFGSNLVAVLSTVASVTCLASGKTRTRQDVR